MNRIRAVLTNTLLKDLEVALILKINKLTIGTLLKTARLVAVIQILMIP